MADVTAGYPGVYIDEVSSGVRPLERAGTSTAAFVGVTQMGPEDATRITNWTEFQRVYGEYIHGSLLPQSVFQFFNNGGRQCYVVRVVDAGAKQANVTVQNRAASPAPGVTFAAKSRGAWGNYLYLQIEDGGDDPGNEFKVSVRRQENVDVVPQGFREIPPLEVFDNLSCDPTSPRFVTEVLKNQSALITATVHTPPQFPNGVHLGGTNPTVPDGDNRRFLISLDGDGFQEVEFAAAPDGSADDLEKVAERITYAVGLLKPKKQTDPTAFVNFKCTVQTEGAKNWLELKSGTVKATSSVRIAAADTNDATKSLKIGPPHGKSVHGSSVQLPHNADSVQLGDAAEVAPVLGRQSGSDGDPDAPLSSPELQRALKALDNITDVSLLAVPGEESVEAPIMKAAMAYCATRPLQDMFYIGETPLFTDTEAEATEFRGKLQANSYGALYFPWIKAVDPSGASRDPVMLPPSGFIAGLYARIDAARGVWKAPAGVEATLNGVLGLAAELNDIEHGILNKKGVCVLRRFPTAGVVAFGARTITNNAEWKYIPVRRMAIMLRVSIYYGIQWAVFEPNDEPLWSQLRLNIGSFMTTLFRQGAFQGSTTSQAFFVKCDSETTTQADIDSGFVNVLIGFAPLKPAEFVVVKISQKAGAASS